MQTGICKRKKRKGQCSRIALSSFVDKARNAAENNSRFLCDVQTLPCLVEINGLEPSTS